LSELRQAGEALREKIQRTRAIGAALALDRLARAGHDAVFSDPLDPSTNLLNPRRAPWPSNPEAAELHKQLTALCAPAMRHVAVQTGAAEQIQTPVEA
jgi:hypothetical protein